MRRPSLGRRRDPQDLAIARPLATIASVALKPREVGDNPLSTGIPVDIPRWRASKPLSVLPGTRSLTPRAVRSKPSGLGPHRCTEEDRDHPNQCPVHGEESIWRSWHVPLAEESAPLRALTVKRSAKRSPGGPTARGKAPAGTRLQGDRKKALVTEALRDERITADQPRLHPGSGTG